MKNSKRIVCILSILSFITVSSSYKSAVVYGKENNENRCTGIVSVEKSKDVYKLKYEKNIEEIIKSEAALILKDGIKTDWQAAAVANSGNELPKEYMDNIKENLKKSKGIMRLPTDYERTVIGVLAAGGNAENFEGINLIEKVYNNKTIRDQGINAYIFALIALDAEDYKIPDNAIWNRDKLVKAILKCRTEDGGWDFAGIQIDPDMTGMALTALAPYRERKDVKEAIDKAVDSLSKIQKEDGSFESWNIKNCESAAQVIIGLCANGIDPTDSRFTKNGVNVIDSLLSFRNKEGGFLHISSDKKSDIKATEQAVQALEAYKNFMEEKGCIYKFIRCLEKQ